MPLKFAGFGHRPLKQSTIVSVAMLCVLLLAAGQTAAHFLLNLNTRIIHVEHLSNGLRVYLRLPMPYLVANLVGPDQPEGGCRLHHCRRTGLQPLVQRQQQDNQKDPEYEIDDCVPYVYDGLVFRQETRIDVPRGEGL